MNRTHRSLGRLWLKDYHDRASWIPATAEEVEDLAQWIVAGAPAAHLLRDARHALRSATLDPVIRPVWKRVLELAREIAV